MKTATIAITKHGAAIAQQLSGDRFIKSKFKPEGESEDNIIYFDSPIKGLTAEIWPRYDALVYVVSLGAVVRTIAHFLKDKHEDPAIIVVDDKAQFVISVLSGHVGGANELTQKIADQLGAKAIITTASDVGKTIPVDILGRELGWTTEGEAYITPVSAAVVNEEVVAFVQETGELNWWKRARPLPKNIELTSLEKLEAESARFSALLCVTDRIISNPPIRQTVFYRPKSLVLGIGCDRGTSCERIEAFILEILKKEKLSFKSVRNVATAEAKRDEVGLNQFCDKHGFKLICYASEILKGVKAPNPSAMVLKHVGTPGVSEPAAMLSSGGTLIVPKQKTKNMTLAVARVSFENGETS
ncbi:Cobalt-precorrin 5A hydrolase [hydrothermal vent metagenome]|uniref:Cobalt-precorrin 5A hydrolase n=1 Tax=hydrothermal vent metagenome TaxID=652676 RepID=A0A3B1CTL2_9ZZZZ